MGIIELTSLIGATWCVVLAFGATMFAAASKADHRDDALRGLTEPATKAAPEGSAVVPVSRFISA
jgi:hypothetical protein